MVAGRCLWCDSRTKRGSAFCAAHARRFEPGHRGRPPERVRELRRRIERLEATFALQAQLFSKPNRLPSWLRRHRERYGLAS